MTKKKMSKVGLWTMIILVVLIFISSAVTKFFEAESQVANAGNWGIPYDLMYFIGAYEIIVVRLLVKGPRHYGALALTIQMIVAAIVHLAHDEALFSLLNLVLTGFAFGIYKLDKRLKVEKTSLQNG